jgi:hypothetical protein
MSSTQSGSAISGRSPDRILAMMRTLALFCMVFLRNRIGPRVLKLTPTFGVALLMFLLNAIGNATSPWYEHSSALSTFAWMFLARALFLRWRGWRMLKRGVRLFTMSTGASYIERVRLPIRRDYIYRLVDPAFGFLVGLCLHTKTIGLPGLGLWIMFSAVCLFATENSLYRKSLSRDLDTLDALHDSENQAAAVTHFDQPAPSPYVRGGTETGGISTGADGLESAIANRKKGKVL